MRGIDERPAQLFSYVDLERRVSADHPLRPIRALVDEVLDSLSRTFARLYARDGRPGIPPNGCCARCCCKRSIVCAPSGS